MFVKSKNDVRKWIFYIKDFLLPTPSLSIWKKATSLLMPQRGRTCQINHQTSPKSCNTTLEYAKQHGYHALVKNAFYAPSTRSRKSDCEIGHRNEQKIIESFHRLIENGKDTHGRIIHIPGMRKILGYYTTGIVKKRDKPFVKDSIDFLVLVELEDGSLKCWGGEVKARTRNGTKHQEVAYQRCRFTSQPHTPILSFFDMANVHCNIQNVGERSQLLHHAYTYDFEKMIFLIGDVNARLIHADIGEIPNTQNTNTQNALTHFVIC